MNKLQTKALNYFTANGINPDTVAEARYELREGYGCIPSPYATLTEKDIEEVLEELSITRQN